MQCPRCATPLTPTVRAGQPVAGCAGCGGVWLDWGTVARIAVCDWELAHGWETASGAPRAGVRWETPGPARRSDE